MRSREARVQAMIRRMNVRELRAMLGEMIAEGLDQEAAVTICFRDVDSDECYIGGLLHIDTELGPVDTEAGCCEDEGLIIVASNDPEDFEKTEPDARFSIN